MEIIVNKIFLNGNTPVFRNGDGYDPLQPGTPRDSWGLSYGATSSQGDPFG